MPRLDARRARHGGEEIERPCRLARLHRPRAVAAELRVQLAQRARATFGAFTFDRSSLGSSGAVARFASAKIAAK